MLKKEKVAIIKDEISHFILADLPILASIRTRSELDKPNKIFMELSNKYLNASYKELYARAFIEFTRQGMFKIALDYYALYQNTQGKNALSQQLIKLINYYKILHFSSNSLPQEFNEEAIKFAQDLITKPQSILLEADNLEYRQSSSKRILSARQVQNFEDKTNLVPVL